MNPPKCIWETQKQQQKGEKRHSDGSVKTTSSVNTTKSKISLGQLSDCDPSVDEIGEGCFGRIYKALLHWTFIAYKVCKLSKRDIAKGAKQLVENEVQICGSFRHPSVVQLKGFVQTPTSVGLVSKYLLKNLEEVLFEGNDNECAANNQSRSQPIAVYWHHCPVLSRLGISSSSRYCVCRCQAC